MLAIAARRGLNVASIDIAEVFTQVPYPDKFHSFLQLPKLLQARHGRYVELLRSRQARRQDWRTQYLG